MTKTFYDLYMFVYRVVLVYTLAMYLCSKYHANKVSVLN